MLPKNKRIEIPKLLKAVQGRPCAYCGIQCETVVPAHYTGVGSNRLGKGKGVKPHDICVAALCHACHESFDRYSDHNDAERGLEFLLLCFETLAQSVRDGVIK